MAELARMVQTRRGKTPYEDMAHEIGLRNSTLYRFLNGNRNLRIPTIRKIAAWANKKNDVELMDALVVYVLGFDIRNRTNNGKK